MTVDWPGASAARRCWDKMSIPRREALDQVAVGPHVPLLMTTDEAAVALTTEDQVVGGHSPAAGRDARRRSYEAICCSPRGAWTMRMAYAGAAAAGADRIPDGHAVVGSRVFDQLPRRGGVAGDVSSHPEAASLTIDFAAVLSKGRHEPESRGSSSPAAVLFPPHRRLYMPAMRKTTAALLAIGALSITAVPAVAQPGEGPGNGGGQSGQCTGPQDDRPSNCNSKGGPGDQGGN